MKKIKLQIKNAKSIPGKEQVVNLEGDFYVKLLRTLGICDGEMTISVQAGPHIDDGEEALERLLSEITGVYVWKPLINPEELYEDFAPREKELLYILSAYETEQVMAITGLKKNSLSKILTSIYAKIDPERKKKKHSVKDLREFCKELEQAGVQLIVWNEEMEKKRRRRKK